MSRNNTPEPASAVSPMHYQHCREDIRLSALSPVALPVVDAAEQQGVSVWKALAVADIAYDDKMLIANYWRDAGRGPSGVREEFYQ